MWHKKQIKKYVTSSQVCYMLISSIDVIYISNSGNIIDYLYFTAPKPFCVTVSIFSIFLPIFDHLSKKFNKFSLRLNILK